MFSVVVVDVVLLFDTVHKEIIAAVNSLNQCQEAPLGFLVRVLFLN